MLLLYNINKVCLNKRCSNIEILKELPYKKYISVFKETNCWMRDNFLK